MSEYLPEGRLSADPSNLHKMSSPKLLHEAAQTGDVLEARAVMCDAAHNLTVDLGCMRGVIPREDGALGIRDGSVRDIAIISRVNRPVCFTVRGFHTDRSGAECAILSRENAQKKC
ncbi:MAG: 30S ribosomal protein S1, partial [Ruminococcus sp.]|nr:30S ribosomal protein S1 [Ruminococcus sp.]